MGAGGMKRRELLLSLLASAVPLGAGKALAQVAPSRAGKPESGAPNVILVVSDQHRAGMTKATGYPLDTSTGLEALARCGAGGRASCRERVCQNVTVWGVEVSLRRRSYSTHKCSAHTEQ